MATMTPEEKQAALAQIEADRLAHPELTLSPEDYAKATNWKPGVGSTIGSMAYKGLGGMTGGLSDYALKVLLPRWAQIKMENAVKATDPRLNAAANIAGIVGSPLGLIGKDIKGTTTLGRIGAAAAKGAIGAGAQAAPSNILGAATGEKSVEEALKSQLGQMAAGGALGGAFGAGSEGLKAAKGILAKYSPRIAEKLNEKVLGSVGIDAEGATRKLLRGSEEAVGETGAAALKTSKAFAQHADAIQNEAADIIHTQGIKSWDMLKDYVQANLDNPAAQSRGFDLLTTGLAMGKKGSDLAKAAKNLALGGAAGTALGMTSKKFDIKDPATWGTAAAGALVGLAAPRLMSRAGGLKSLLPEAAGEVAPTVAGKAAEILPTIAAKTPAIVQALSPEEKKVATTEAQVTPEAQVAARAEVNAKYAQRISRALQDAWTLKYAAQGVDYEGFVKAVAARTDDFDPKKSAGILFPDKSERAKFLKDYDIALKLGNTNIEEAYKGKKTSIMDSLFNQGKAAVEKSKYDNLVDLLASTVSSGTGLPSATERKAVEADLTQVMRMPAEAGDKKTLLLNLLANKYHLNLAQLQELGLQ